MAKEEMPIKFIEVKLSTKIISKPLLYFSSRYPQVESLQLVYNLHQEEEKNNVKVLRLYEWLGELSA